MLCASGVGKTHIALAIAQRTVGAGHKVRFITAADLMLQLATTRSQGRLKEYFNRAVLGPKLLVVDEIVYLPFGREEANMFFNVVAKRYERGSMVLTSNLPFTQWAGAFADNQTLTAAMRDRCCTMRTSCRARARATGSRRSAGRATHRSRQYEREPGCGHLDDALARTGTDRGQRWRVAHRRRLRPHEQSLRPPTRLRNRTSRACGADPGLGGSDLLRRRRREVGQISASALTRRRQCSESSASRSLNRQQRRPRSAMMETCRPLRKCRSDSATGLHRGSGRVSTHSTMFLTTPAVLPGDRMRPAITCCIASSASSTSTRRLVGAPICA